MIFVRDKGRMCNNILQFAHVYAWAREHGRKAVSMRFAYKYQYFHICHTPWHNFLTYSAVKYAAKAGLLPVAGFHNVEGNPEAQQLLESRRNLVVEGWEVRYYDLFLKYRKDIVSLFAFDNCVMDKVRSMMSGKRRGRISLGLHVRRGDYKTWHNGQYYYSDQQYAAVVKKFAQQHPDETIDVFVCGNDPKLASMANAINDSSANVVVSEGTPAEDLCMLSECDFIIGAPSTFSLVAAMYNDRPLYWIMSPDDDISFDKFENLFRRII